MLLEYTETDSIESWKVNESTETDMIYSLKENGRNLSKMGKGRAKGGNRKFNLSKAQENITAFQSTEKLE